MARDIKLNIYQHTSKQLKKKCELFKQKYEGTKFDPIFKPYNQRIIEEVQQKQETEESVSDEE
jgi:hypothetical protein